MKSNGETEKISLKNGKRSSENKSFTIFYLFIRFFRHQKKNNEQQIPEDRKRKQTTRWFIPTPKVGLNKNPIFKHEIT